MDYRGGTRVGALPAIDSDNSSELSPSGSNCLVQPSIPVGDSFFRWPSSGFGRVITFNFAPVIAICPRGSELVTLGGRDSTDDRMVNGDGEIPLKLSSSFLTEMEGCSGVPRPHFRPDIEGLRAIAILLVVGYHAGLPGFSGGYVGVDIFFVLSGYLITWLLVHEAQETGSINLPRFYARRARRLLPALALVLVTTIILGAMVYAPLEQRYLANTAVATATYLSNVLFALGATDYLGADQHTNPLLHTWSLSLEEQFYIVWPLFVMVAFGATRWQRHKSDYRRLIVWMAGAVAISFAVSSYLTSTNQPWAFFSSPTRAWEFAVGACGILLPVGSVRKILGHRVNLGRDENRPRLVQICGWTGMGGFLAGAVLYTGETSFPGTAALLPVFSTILVLRAGAAATESRLSKLLALGPLQRVGRVSYSWYLWHWPVLVFGTAIFQGLSITFRILLLVGSLLLAEASHRFIENPVRHGSWLSARPRRSLAMAVLLGMFGVALALAWRQAAAVWAYLPYQQSYTKIRNDNPAIYASGCIAPLEGSDLVECTYGGNGAPQTAVLVGDSHAAQWLDMVEPMVEDGRWRLVVITKSSCPMVILPPHFDTRMGRFSTECDTWRTKALSRIDQLSPDLTIVSTFDGYPFSFQEWKKGEMLALAFLSKASRKVVVVRDTPTPGFDVPACLARAKWFSTTFPRSRCRIEVNSASPSDAYRAITGVAAGMGNVSILDMNGHICPAGSCSTVHNGVIVFRDAHHITEAFASGLSDNFIRYAAAFTNDTVIPTFNTGGSRANALTDISHLRGVTPH